MRCWLRRAGLLDVDVDGDQRADSAAGVADRTARVEACRRVGRDAHSVAQVARKLGVGWGAVVRAVAGYGRPLIDDSDRLAGGQARRGRDRLPGRQRRPLHRLRHRRRRPGRTAAPRRRGRAKRESLNGLGFGAAGGMAGRNRHGVAGGPVPWLRRPACQEYWSCDGSIFRCAYPRDLAAALASGASVTRGG